jgi:hypothetical protein
MSFNSTFCVTVLTKNILTQGNERTQKGGRIFKAEKKERVIGIDCPKNKNAKK